MDENILEIRNLKKLYPGVVALEDISLNIKRGNIHCLVGENGAGKSTLIKILTGVTKKTEGTILLNGQDYAPNNVNSAKNKGIYALYQELNVIDQLNVEQNLLLGLEETKLGIIHKSAKLQRIIEVLRDIDDSIDARQLVSKLSVAKKQLIEIVRCITSGANIIILDEPTAALSETETKKLFIILNELKQKGITIVYISHRLDEIFMIADYITVLRDGRAITTEHISGINERSDLIKLMLGKDVMEKYVPSGAEAFEKILIVDDINNARLKNISFYLCKGEIIGFYGLLGAGKTELASVLFGKDKYRGYIKYKGKEFKVGNPSNAIKSGIALVPEERRNDGLFTGLNIRDNIHVMNPKKVSKLGFYLNRLIKKASNTYINSLNIATTNDTKTVALLSGGNQQKIVLSKCLFAEPNIMLLDEPTRGIDVGAKQEIYNIIRELAKKGISTIIFSSELSEITQVCDRILILNDGEIKAEIVNGKNIDKNYLLHVATGG